MAQQDDCEAITVVIEKLTEIVENANMLPQAHVETSTQCEEKAVLIQEEGAPEINLIRHGPEVEKENSTSDTITDGDMTDLIVHDVQQQVAPVSVLAEIPGKRSVVLPTGGHQEVIEKTESDPGSTGQPGLVPVLMKLPAPLSQLNLSNTHTLLEGLIHLNHDQLCQAPPDGTHVLQMTNREVPSSGTLVQTVGASDDGTMTFSIQNQSGVHVLTPTKSSSGIPVQVSLAPGNQHMTPGGVQYNKPPGGSNNIGTFECDKCNYSSCNKHYLKQHIELVHRTDRPFKCPFCEYAGKRSHSLKEHLVVHSTNRPYECPVCNATFRKKGHLTTHVKLHLKYFECTICQQKYNDRTQLYGHLRQSHAPDEVYSCKLCDYATTIKSNIVMHMHTHGNPEVYRCNVCSFTALHINILRQHMETHVGVDPTATYNIEMRSIKPQPVILLKCSECGYTTDHKDALQKHMWQHLPDVHEKTPVALNGAESSQMSSFVSSPSHPGESVKSQPEQVIYRCSEMACNFSSREAYIFITHMLSHKPRQRIAGQRQQQQEQEQMVMSQKAPQSSDPEPKQAFTHDSAVGMYRCTICGYMCEHQRTIKAHIWKHSGHKDIDYPMFQNGPLSVYDDTPVGKPVLLTGGSQMRSPPVKVIPLPEGLREEASNKGSDVGNENKPELVGAEVVSGPSPDPQVNVESQAHIPQGVSTAPIRSSIVQSSSLLPPVSLNTKTAIPVPVVNRMPVMQPVKVTPVNQNDVLLVRPRMAQLKPFNRGMVGSTTKLLRAPTPGLVQSIGRGTPFSSPAASSPEIVQLILGAKQGTEDIGGEDGSLKRKGGAITRAEETEDGDPMLGVAKRFCSESDVSVPSTGNVVVQQVAQVYTTPKITLVNSRAGSPRSSSPPGIDNAITHMVSSSERPQVLISEKLLPINTEKTPAVEEEEEDEGVVAMETIIEDTEHGGPIMIGEVIVETGKVVETSEPPSDVCQDTITLLSLLKKSPPGGEVDSPDGCTVSAEESSSRVSSPDTEISAKDGNGQVSNQTDEKPKKGICSSLLAVIEQLRERSKSESEGDDGTDSNKSVPRTGGKKRARRQSVEEDMPMEQYLNVEKLVGESVQYRCRLCHYTSSSTSLIRTHMRLHKTKQPFECSLCDHQAESSESLQEHMLQHCKVRTYHCKVCTAVFNYKSQLRAHMRAHNEKDPFLCDICEFETYNPIAFRNHSRVHTDVNKVIVTSTHPGNETGEENSQPNKGSQTQDEVVFTDDSNPQCDECSFVGNSQEDLLSHTRSNHVKSYKCEHCDFISPTFSSLRNHWRMHVDEQPLKCELCDFIATSSRSLKSHMKRHVNDQRFVQQPLEQYKCNMCGYVCHHLPSLKSHMWRHASDINYSYKQTNDVINAAIDFDTKPAVTHRPASPLKANSPPQLQMPELRGSNTAVLTTQSPPRTASVSESQKASAAETTTATTTIANSANTTNLIGNNSSSNIGNATPVIVQSKSQDRVSKQTRTCLVAFRCCQCGFESIDKSLLNSHMKTHMDIIRKTLEVNRSRLVTKVTKSPDSNGKEETEMDVINESL